MTAASILLALRVPSPPERPMPTQAQAERIGHRMADDFEAAADAWIASTERARLSAEHMKATSAAAENDLQALGSRIADLEAMAEIRAAAAPQAALGGNIAATERRVVEALLEHALFLRALRSEIDPASRGGPTFETMGDLERHLASLGAA